MDKEKLSKKLNSLEVPDQLEARIRSDWQQQNAERNVASQFMLKLTAVAASFVVAMVVLRITFSTPALVTAAIDDIAEDAKHSVGIAVDFSAVLSSRNIDAPLQKMPVRMSKYCELDEQKTLHMQVAGEQQGHVHLFVRDGRFDHFFWQAEEGVAGDMQWRIIQPSDDLSVLVVFTPDMNPVNVEKLVRHMFYS